MLQLHPRYYLLIHFETDLLRACAFWFRVKRLPHPSLHKMYNKTHSCTPFSFNIFQSFNSFIGRGKGKSGNSATKSFFPEIMDIDWLAQARACLILYTGHPSSLRNADVTCLRAVLCCKRLLTKVCKGKKPYVFK